MTVADVVERARAAQTVTDDRTADRTQELTTTVACSVARKDRAEWLGGLVVATGGAGMVKAAYSAGNARQFVNLTWVSRLIPPRVIDADALFADHIRRYGP
jgi:hypothetical protein